MFILSAIVTEDTKEAVRYTTGPTLRGTMLRVSSDLNDLTRG